jgi:hypothetical protein
MPKVPAAKVIAVITDPHEVRKIHECWKRDNSQPIEKVETKDS